jgi:Protein of unknown function (DUF3500)
MGQQPVNYDGVNKPLHDEESAAFAIIESLDDDKLARAVIHPVSPADFVTRYVPRIGAVEYPDVIDLGMPQYRLSDKDRIATRLVRDEPSGLAASELDTAQQGHLLTIVDRFLERHPKPIAVKLQQEIRDRGLERVHFAWAGDIRRGTPHYFRGRTGRTWPGGRARSRRTAAPPGPGTTSPVPPGGHRGAVASQSLWHRSTGYLSAG